MVHAPNDPVAFGTGVFWSYVLLYLAGLILSVVMVRSRRFARWIGILGIVANTFGLGYFVTSIGGAWLSILPALGSAPTNLVWYMAVGIQLLRPSRPSTSPSTDPPAPPRR